jgi:iron complex transport system substrate-binding protein
MNSPFRTATRPALTAVLLLVTVAIAPAQPAPGGTVDGIPAPRHARSFDAVACDHLITLTVSNAWDGAPDLTYALVPQGSPAPPPAGYAGVISLPVRRIASLTTSALPHLADLGALDRLVAIDTVDYVYSRTVIDAVAGRRIAEVGTATEFDLERLLAERPDLVIASAYGPDDPTIERITAAGIPVLVYADWREETPLGRAEWVRVIGLLLEREATARELFETREAAYRELAERVAAAVDPEGSLPRPTIMANAPWQGSWPVPAGESYVARLFADAGGAYLWADQPGTGSRFLDLESVLARAAAADYWINLNVGWRSRSDVTRLDPRLAAFGPYQSGELYHHNRRVRPSGANDFWESGAARPDLVLQDLVRILHPDMLPGETLYYYRRLDR